MKQYFANLAKYVGSSFDNHSQGASARKLLSFFLMCMTGYLHWKWVDSTNAFEFLVADLAGALLCLGIITMEQIIKLKNGATDTPPSDAPTVVTPPPPSEELPVLD